MSDRPRRLILVNRVYWPSTAATAQLLADLAEGLAARGWEVQVIAAGETSTTRNGVTIHRTGDGDRHGGLVSRFLNYARFRRVARRQLETLAQPGDVVVVMTDPPMLGTDLAGTVAARGAHLVHWVQDIYPEILSAHLGPLAAPFLAPLRSRRNAAWRAAATCVTLGEDMRRTLALGGVPDDRLALVPNWAPRELDQPAMPDAIAARRAAWDVQDKFVVAYSGNLGRVHEFKTVMAAAEQLKDRDDIVFVFIGNGARFEEVRSLARARQLANVRLLPPEPRENLAAALAAADIQLVTLQPQFSSLVYPSKLAGVLAAGRPVLFIGPAGGEIARLLEAEGCGGAVAPGQMAQLAGLITSWRDEPSRLQGLGARARATYERHFTYATALARWESVLRQAGR